MAGTWNDAVSTWNDPSTTWNDSAGAAVFIQSKSNTNTGTTVTCNMSSNSTAGDLIVALFTAPAGTTLVSVTDTAGSSGGASNTYIQFGSKYTVLGADVYVYYTFAAVTHANSVVVTWGSSVGADLIVLEYSGVTNPTSSDGDANSTGSGAAITGPTINTTNANDLLISFVGANSALSGVSSGWTVREHDGFDDSAADNIQTATGAFQISATNTSGGWLVRTVAFKVSVSASTQNITPSGIASTNAFGTPSVSPGAVNISPTGIASTNAFGTATVSPGAVNIAPSGSFRPTLSV
jgi:hypothetical protein